MSIIGGWPTAFWYLLAGQKTGIQRILENLENLENLV